MQHNLKIHGALALAGLALVVAVVAVVLGSSGASMAGPGACVDPEARAELGELRRALAERDALSARLAGAPAIAPAVPSPPAGGAAGADTAPPQATSPEPGPRRYTRFVIPNPAVSVTQREDGFYDVRTTDPSLAGTVLQVTAITQSGEEDQMLIRIPQ